MQTINGSKWNSYLTLGLLIFTFYSPIAGANPKQERHSYKGETYKDEKQEPCAGQICDPFRFIISLTGGAAWANVGESQSFTDDESKYAYDADQGKQSKYMWGGAIGEELRFYPDWSIQIDLAYYQTQAFQAEGTVTQGVDPATDEKYHYEYNVIARQYLVEGKFLGDMAFGIHPYALVGVGASFNSVYDYGVDINHPDSFPTFSPKYEKNTNITFSYIAGVGADFDLMNNLRLGIGYRFAWFGHANTGDGEINTVPISHSLNQKHLNVQEAVMQLTFLL